MHGGANETKGSQLLANNPNKLNAMKSKRICKRFTVFFHISFRAAVCVSFMYVGLSNV